MSAKESLRSKVFQSQFRFIAIATHHFLVELWVYLVDLLNRIRMRRHHARATGLKLNLGCGSKTRDGFINVDLSSAADFRIDLRRAIPLPDRSCTLIIAEHFLEHLEYPAVAMTFLRECRRLLQPGGRLILSVPDTEEPLRRYGDPEAQDYFVSERVRGWHASWCVTPLEHINYHFRQNAHNRPAHNPEYHHFAYDFTTISKALMESGFSRVGIRAFDLALDSADRYEGSLRVSAE